VAQDERDRQLDQRGAGLFDKLRQLPDRVELELGGWLAEVEALGDNTDIEETLGALTDLVRPGTWCGACTTQYTIG
jgi:hypothetical protein